MLVTGFDYTTPNVRDIAVDPQGHLITAGYTRLALSDSAPAPAGSDLTNAAGGALIAADFAIRDTATHAILIPMAPIYTHVALLLHPSAGGVSYDQPVGMWIYPSLGTGSIDYGQLVSFTVPASLATGYGISISPHPSTGPAYGASPASPLTHYAAPALATMWPYLKILMQATTGSAPTAGTWGLSVIRWRGGA